MGENTDTDKGDLVDQVKSAVDQAVNQQKDRMAERLSAVAEAMKDTGRTLVQHNATAARYAQTWAARVEGVAETVKVRSAGQLVSVTEDFARRQPGLFVGAAVAAGFMLARVLRGDGGGDGQVAGTADAGEPMPAVAEDALRHLTGQAL
ncbi:MAG TPA: hypothetical protein HPQ04_05105 [Rhodospirillaceae bacterium]|nr:hypothetical protein [Rhodospirillaceae bacterium]